MHWKSLVTDPEFFYYVAEIDIIQAMRDQHEAILFTIVENLSIQGLSGSLMGILISQSAKVKGILEQFAFLCTLVFIGTLVYVSYFLKR